MIKSCLKLLTAFFFILVISLDAYSCTNARNRINRFFESRTQAFNNAKRDAGVPRTQQPSKVEHVPMTDRNNNPIFDENRRMIMTREYHYVTNKGQRIIIQEHTAGHGNATRAAGGMPHLNVRPLDNPRTGTVAGTANHYNIGAE